MIMSGEGTAAVGGRTVGEWALDVVIGSGSFAAVWKARHIHTGAAAAIKEIATDRLNKKLQESLASEIQVLETTKHQNIVCMLDIIKEPGKIFLVLEFCGGGDLGHYLRHHGRVGEATARYFLQQLAEGLKVLRKLNLIHRDLKPQNLLLTNPPEAVSGSGVPSSLLKIADFGFARSLMPQGLAETLCGSPLYMAPEILQYHKYDAKADLWSVGTILFEMVTGKPPFNGANHLQLLQNIERSEARIPEPIAEMLSPSCRMLIQQLLQRNPVQRISFEEFFSHPFLTGVEPPPPATPSSRSTTPPPPSMLASTPVPPYVPSSPSPPPFTAHPQQHHQQQWRAGGPGRPQSPVPWAPAQLPAAAALPAAATFHELQEEVSLLARAAQPPQPRGTAAPTSSLDTGSSSSTSSGIAGAVAVAAAAATAAAAASQPWLQHLKAAHQRHLVKVDSNSDLSESVEGEYVIVNSKAAAARRAAASASMAPSTSTALPSASPSQQYHHQQQQQQLQPYYQSALQLQQQQQQASVSQFAVLAAPRPSYLVSTTPLMMPPPPALPGDGGFGAKGMSPTKTMLLIPEHLDKMELLQRVIQILLESARSRFEAAAASISLAMSTGGGGGGGAQPAGSFAPGGAPPGSASTAAFGATAAALAAASNLHVELLALYLFCSRLLSAAFSQQQQQQHLSGLNANNMMLLATHARSLLAALEDGKRLAPAAMLRRASSSGHAHSHAATASGEQPGQQGSTVMPSGLDIVYDSALRLSRAAAVDELMGNWSGSVELYARAGDLLLFLLVDVPTVVQVKPQLAPPDQSRLVKYLNAVKLRQASCMAMLNAKLM